MSFSEESHGLGSRDQPGRGEPGRMSSSNLMRGLNTYKKETRKSPLTAEEREAAILQHIYLVKRITNRIAMRLPSHVEVQDLYSAGTVGLIDALEKFDPSKGVPFGAYAEFRIRGAVFDELRALDQAPRSVRTQCKRVEEAFSALESSLAREPDDQEMAEALGVELNEYQKMLMHINSSLTLSLNQLIGDQLGGVQRKQLLESLVDNRSPSPSEYIEASELKRVLADAIGQLPRKHQLVLSLYYYEEMNMKEVGAALKITESRVSQIHAKCMMALKKKIRNALNDTV